MEKKLVDIEFLNKEARKDLHGFVESCERNYHSQIDGIAKIIVDNFDKIKVVLLSGPSSSGKTTTSEILIEKLANRGINSITVSTDDFFIDRAKVKLLKDGTKDYENIEATDIPLLKECVGTLLKKGKAFFPRYDFLTGESIKRGRIVNMGKDDILIIEGIHALNPVLTKDPLFKDSLKLYVCVYSNFSYKGRVYLTPKELRLTRRILRDCMTRGSTAAQSLKMWKHVLEGEDLYIKPYIDDADYVIDTTHGYEPLLYKDLILPKLMRLKDNPIVENMIRDYGLFDGINQDVIPSDSLLNEFVILWNLICLYVLNAKKNSRNGVVLYIV